MALPPPPREIRQYEAKEKWRAAASPCRANRDPMSKREIIVQELEAVPEKDFDAVLNFIHSLKSRNSEDALPSLLAESSLLKDWLLPEEEAAWADL
jgi:hypothetical protein